MAKQPKADNRAKKQQEQGPKQQTKAAAKIVVPFWERPKTRLLLAAGIALITWVFYSVCLDNQLTNWDDPGYIRDNPLIKDLSGEGLKQIFSTAVMGNYHPLTILSYAIEYSFVRLDPWLYHLDSVLLHILVTILSYFFVLKLTRKPVAALVVGVLFGLHPMHVESVAWLAGRKDVMYGAFYMAACIAYLDYARAPEHKRLKWYIAATLLFLGALLSKPVAVTLPLVFLLIDYWESGKLTKKQIINKLPLLGISILFGIKSMIDQKAFGSLTDENEAFTFVERIGLGGYAFITYLWKAIAPYNLSCFYPYPGREGGSISFTYYLYTLGALVLLGLVWMARRNRAVVFGSLFFLINIALLLQFIPVGGAILADRYSYIAYLGLFFMAGWFVSEMMGNPKTAGRGNMVLAGVMVWSLYLGTLTRTRCEAWCDTTSLWRDEIEKQPNAPNAYNNLGFHYFNLFNESMNEADRKRYFDSSYNLLHMALQLDEKFVNSYVSLGELHRAAGKFAEAKELYYKAISLNDHDGSANAYLGLAIIYAISNNMDSSGICFKNAIALKPYFPELHSNYGNFFDMQHMTDSALNQYGIAIQQNPDAYAPYLNRGRLYRRLNRQQEAMNDFNTAAMLSPENGEIYYARARCNFANNNKQAAREDLQHAQALGFNRIDPRFVEAVMNQ